MDGTPATVDDVMLHAPKSLPAGATVADARTMLEDDHVHSVLVLDRRRLLAVVERSDIVDALPSLPAARTGRLAGRTVGEGTILGPVWHELVLSGQRRRAVVDGRGNLLGLLCLKRDGTGFCTDEGVQARAEERAVRANGAHH